MWLERFQIVFTSTHADFMPSAWDTVWPTAWDWAVYIGTLGLFTSLILLFVRLAPLISMHDMRVDIHERVDDWGDETPDEAPDRGTREGKHHD
jgi:molybdopterin-containing oxidoreductase family membrane subunit